jgi:hypothetical protein
LRTSTMARTVRTTSTGIANARQPKRPKNQPGARPRRRPGRTGAERAPAASGVRSTGPRLALEG